MESNNMPIKKEAGTSAPDGYKELACSKCNTIWYVPEGMDAFVCPDCAAAEIAAIEESKKKATK